MNDLGLIEFFKFPNLFTEVGNSAVVVEMPSFLHVSHLLDEGLGDLLECLLMLHDNYSYPGLFSDNW